MSRVTRGRNTSTIQATRSVSHALHVIKGRRARRGRRIALVAIRDRTRRCSASRVLSKCVRTNARPAQTDAQDTWTDACVNRIQKDSIVRANEHVARALRGTWADAWKNRKQDGADVQLRLSVEQSSAMLALRAGRNVSVQAVPGAGKTTFLVHAMKSLQADGLRVLGVTYSSALKNEWRCKDPGNRRHVHSFHSLAKTAFAKEVRNDDELRAALSLHGEGLAPSHACAYDVVFLDEAQDCCERYVQLLAAVVGSRRPQFCVVGQAGQCVFDYKSGDLRADGAYITRAEERFAPLATDREWYHTHFSKSFRLTPTVAGFINRFFHLQPIDRIAGSRSEESTRVDYHIVNIWEEAQVAQIIHAYIAEFGSKQTCIITPSRGAKESPGKSTPYQKIHNMLSNTFRVSFQQTGDGGTCVREMTCCGSKGQECACAIVVGADGFSSWVSTAQRFVAFTRSWNLVVLQSYNQDAWNGALTVKEIEACGARVFVHRALQKPVATSCAPQPMTVSDMAEAFVETKRGREAVSRAFMQTSGGSGAWECSPAVFAMDDGNEFVANVPLLYGVMLPMHREREQQCPVLYGRIFNPIAIDHTAPLLGVSRESFAECDARCREAIVDICRLMQARDGTALWQTYAVRLQRRSEAENIDEQILAHLRTVEGRCSHRFITRAKYDASFPPEHRDRLNSLCPPETSRAWTPMQTMRAAVAAQSYESFHYRLNQVTAFDWVDTTIVEAAMEVLSDAVPTRDADALRWEQELTLQLSRTYNTGRPAPVSHVIGRADVCDSCTDTVFEIKFSSVLSNADKLQLLLYMHMYRSTHARDVTRGVLVSVKTGEVWKACIATGAQQSREFVENFFAEQIATTHSMQSCAPNPVDVASARTETALCDHGIKRGAETSVQLGAEMVKERGFKRGLERGLERGIPHVPVDVCQDVSSASGHPLRQSVIPAFMRPKAMSESHADVGNCHGVAERTSVETEGDVAETEEAAPKTLYGRSDDRPNVLEGTFAHIEGMSLGAERQLWTQGFVTHDRFLQLASPPMRAKWYCQVVKTQAAVRSGGIQQMAALLPKQEQWRLFGHGSTCYLDIETTGLSKTCDRITCAVLHSAARTKVFVNGINLEKLPDAINEFDTVVTYNGKCFDVPFVEHFFQVRIRCIHLDLRYILGSLGLRGGLKSIETQLGLQERKGTEGVDGAMAVALWRQYEAGGDLGALQKLVAYNYEDTARLEWIMAVAYNRHLQRLPCVYAKLEEPEMKLNPFLACDKFLLKKIIRETTQEPIELPRKTQRVI